MIEERNDVTIEQENAEFDPVKEIQELRANTVSKDDYAKVVAENKRYLKALIDGEQIKSTAEPVDVNTLRKELFGESVELDNLSYCKKALELREALLDQEGVDIFVGSGSKLTPTDEDYAAAQRVAEVMQSCIDSADGNSEVFTAHLMSMTNDVKVPKRK